MTMLQYAPVTTRRLILRAETEQDLETVNRMHTDLEVMRLVGDGRIEQRPWEQFRDWAIQRHATQAELPYLNLSVVLWDTGEYIGWCGLTDEPFTGGIQLGYRYLRNAWGRGYATEAAHAIVALAFGPLGMTKVVATVFPDHAVSRRVLEKVGMTHERDFYHEKAGRDACLYAIQRAVSKPVANF
jgi:RimJ/RimL family protein N-acetyltransferase